MLDRYDYVHLLTYRRTHLWFTQNSEVHVPLLLEKYGDGRFRHVYLDCSKVFHRIFYARLEEDVKEFGTHLALLVCLGCKLAMHACTIVYNIENRIRTSAVGSRLESKLYPAQMRPVKERIEQMYRDYGMDIVSPVYDAVDTDEIIYAKGLTRKKDLKRQFLFYDTQPTCFYGGVAYVYSRCFYAPLFGDEAREEDSIRYFEAKRGVVDEIVRDHFASVEDGGKLLAQWRAPSPGGTVA